MSEMMMVLFLLLEREGPKVPLLDLPSPSYVYGIVSNGQNLKEYQQLLRRTESILMEYKHLSEKEKDECIRAWFHSVKKQHAKCQFKYGNSWTLPSNFQISLEQSKIDLTKIDLLLLADERVPYFHTETWMRNVYSVQKGVSEFKVSWPVRGFSDQFVKNYTGAPPPEPGAASFQGFYAPETRKLIKWIEAKKHIKLEYQPMNEDRMFEKRGKPHS